MPARSADDLAPLWPVVECKPPRVRLEVPRQRIPKILTALLSNYTIEDVGVQERPLEEVIAEMFASAPPRAGRRRESMSLVRCDDLAKRTPAHRDCALRPRILGLMPASDSIRVGTRPRLGCVERGPRLTIRNLMAEPILRFAMLSH